MRTNRKLWHARIVKWLLPFYLFTFLPLHAQIGSWRNYLAYHDVQQIQAAGSSQLFVLASNNLYRYNRQDYTIHTYDKTNGMSDVYITQIVWNKTAKRLVAVYENSNIDIIDLNDNIVNISSLYTKAITGNKTINNVYAYNQYVYLCCGFGIVKIDVNRLEISESYMLGRNITDVVISGDDIYAKIVDKKTTLVGTPVIPYGATTINIDSLEKARYKTDIITYYIKGSLNANLIDAGNWEKCIEDQSSRFTKDNTDYDTYIEEVKTLQPGGPKYNYFEFLRFKHNRLYTCSGGYSAKADLKIPGTVQILNNGTWSVLQDDIADVTGWRYINTLTVDADTDPEHVFVGGQTGLYEFQNGQFVKAWNLDNSPLESNQGEKKHWVLVEGIVFDSANNLWCLNSGAATQSILKLNSDKTWNTYPNSTLRNPDGEYSLYGMRAPFIDSRGLLWFVNYHWLKSSFYCFDTNQKKLVNAFTSLVNQDGTAIAEYYYPHCVCEDMEGNIWVGTEYGPVMVERDNIYTQNTNITQVKVPRNDGTNFADYLLSGIAINDIAIDGGGRKWFATANNGVYLISVDNMTEIHHFTTSNSSLLSDNVTSIAINHETGEVFFGTERGLCSYMSDATTTYDEMTKDNVWAYPNPVTPEYQGLITVVGLTLNADVKILASNGALVAEGRSSGGTFTWNGCDKNGDPVASGVYMVATAKADGSKGTVCKIAIVR